LNLSIRLTVIKKVEAANAALLPRGLFFVRTVSIRAAYDKKSIAGKIFFAFISEW
jgi:hypothetical protein